jgi:hypothetical protein
VLFGSVPEEDVISLDPLIPACLRKNKAAWPFHAPVREPRSGRCDHKKILGHPEIFYWEV